MSKRRYWFSNHMYKTEEHHTKFSKLTQTDIVSLLICTTKTEYTGSKSSMITTQI